MKKISRILLLLGIACCSFGTYAETKASARGNDLKLLSLEEFKNLDPKERGEYYGKLIRLRIVMEFVQNRMIMEATGEEAFSASNWDIRRMQFLDLLMRASTMDSQASTFSTGGENAASKVLGQEAVVAINNGGIRQGLANLSDDITDFYHWATSNKASNAKAGAELKATSAKRETQIVERDAAEAQAANLATRVGTAQGTRLSKQLNDTKAKIDDLSKQIKESLTAEQTAMQVLRSTSNAEPTANNFIKAHASLAKATKSAGQAADKLKEAEKNFFTNGSNPNFKDAYDRAKLAVDKAAKELEEASKAFKESENQVREFLVKEGKLTAPTKEALEELDKTAKAATAAATETKAVAAEAKQAPAAAPAAAARPAAGSSTAKKTGTAAVVGAAAIGGTMIVANKVNSAKSTNSNGAAVAPAAPAAGGAPAGVVGAAAPAAPATAEKPDAKANSLNDGDDCLYGGQTGKMKGGKCNRPAKTKCSPPKNGFQCGNYGIAQLNSPNGRLCVQLHPLKNLTARCTSAVLDAIKNLPNSSHVEGFNKLTTELESLSTRLKSYCAAKLVDDVHSGCSALGTLVDNLNKAKSASAAKPADKANSEKGVK